MGAAEALSVLTPVQHEGARDLHSQRAHMNINKLLVKDWESSSLADLLDAPMSAFEGVTEDQDKIFRSLGIKTIGDLGKWKYFRWARAICTLAQYETEDGSS